MTKEEHIQYWIETAEFKIPDDKKEFLLMLNDFQLEGRYPDYQQKIYQFCTKERTHNILEKVKDTRKWLLKKLP